MRNSDDRWIEWTEDIIFFFWDVSFCSFYGSLTKLHLYSFRNCSFYSWLLFPMIIYFYVLKYFCRNRLLLCILNICRDVLGRLPKIVGVDVVEMALWAKVNLMTLFFPNPSLLS